MTTISIIKDVLIVLILCVNHIIESYSLFCFPPKLQNIPKVSKIVESGSDKQTIIEDMKRSRRIINNSLSNYTTNYKLCVVMNFGDNEVQTYDLQVDGCVDLSYS